MSYITSSSFFSIFLIIEYYIDMSFTYHYNLAFNWGNKSDYQRFLFLIRARGLGLWEKESSIDSNYIKNK